MCDQLVHAGIPLWRVAVFVRTLHPEIMGRRFIWQPDVGVTINEGLFDLLETEQFQNSPFVAVMKSGRTIRRQLADQDNPEEFSIFRELRAEGVHTPALIVSAHQNQGDAELEVSGYVTKPIDFERLFTEIAGLTAS